MRVRCMHSELRANELKLELLQAKFTRRCRGALSILGLGFGRHATTRRAGRICMHVAWRFEHEPRVKDDSLWAYGITHCLCIER